MRGSRLFKVNARFVSPGRWRWNVLIHQQPIATGFATNQLECRSLARQAQATYLDRHQGLKLTVR